MYLASYVEPKSDTDCSPVEIQLTLADAVNRMRQAWRASPRGQAGELDPRSEIAALEDFMVVHWAHFAMTELQPETEFEYVLQTMVQANVNGIRKASPVSMNWPEVKPPTKEDDEKAGRCEEIPEGC